jgi:hypothetical protein
MFNNVVRLELRKQRNDFLVIAGLTVLVILSFILEALYRNRNLSEVL